MVRVKIILVVILLLFAKSSHSQTNIIIYDLDTCQRDPSWVLPGFSGSIMTSTVPEAFGCSSGCAVGCGANNTCSINTAFLTNGWNTVTSNASRYYEFNLLTSPDVSSYLHYIYVSYRRSSSGPTNVSVYLNGTMFGLLPISGTSCSGFGVGINQIYTGNVNFRIRFWGASASDGTVRIDNVRVTHFSTTLPVELLSFSGETSNGRVLLSWETASEQNSSHFEVESSVDSENWKTAEILTAAGNSQNLLSYSCWTDFVADVTYYRLKQVDLDGSFEYSKAIAIYRDLESLWIQDGYLHYNGENGSLVSIWDLQGRYIGNMSKRSWQLERGLYFVSYKDHKQKVWIE
jgi:hypothetical protein